MLWTHCLSTATNYCIYCIVTLNMHLRLELAQLTAWASTINRNTSADALNKTCCTNSQIFNLLYLQAQSSRLRTVHDICTRFLPLCLWQRHVIRNICHCCLSDKIVSFPCHHAAWYCTLCATHRKTNSSYKRTVRTGQTTFYCLLLKFLGVSVNGGDSVFKTLNLAQGAQAKSLTLRARIG